MAGVRLAPRWRFSPSWSLGLLVRVSGEGRFHLLPEGESTAAFGILEVGFAIA